MGAAVLEALRKRQPDFSLGYLQATYPFKRPEQWDLLLRGLEPLGAV